MSSGQRKTVLVTGGAGFLGSHVCRRLIDDGHAVVCLDNTSTGLTSRVESLMGHPAFEFVNRDLLEYQPDRRFDAIYHMASPASPPDYQRLSLETIRVNTVGTERVLQWAREMGASVLYTSTSEAYGDPEVTPQVETYRGNVNTWGPRACYDESKRLGETICYEYYTKFEVPVRVVRIFNTYSAGLRTDDGRVISNFVTQALKGEPITVYGDGSQTRSFCYVDDMVDALTLVMESEKCVGDIFNVGNPEEYTILQLAELVKKLTGSRSEIVFLPLPKDDPVRRRPNIDKIRRVLGWEPKISLAEGLRRTIAEYRRVLNLAS